MLSDTEHVILIEDARSLDEVVTDSVDLVVTSPPYPMIELWDSAFRKMSKDVGEHLEKANGQAAFEAMHEELDSVWDEIKRVMKRGGIVCINIGDATRKLGDSFQQYPNHARVIEALRKRGFHVLPQIFWKKPTNKSTKFMGSGQIPPNQYPTLGHEHILIFRNQDRRSFEPKDTTRYESAYFWEERNTWFSDSWGEINGAQQNFDSLLQDVSNTQDSQNSEIGPNDGDVRDRTAAFPIDIPYRLIQMFSIYGDTVLDPFIGTGTTAIAAAASGRHSIGYEINKAVADPVKPKLQTTPKLSQMLIEDRMRKHQKFVNERNLDDNPPNYSAENYPFGVISEQEQNIKFYKTSNIELKENLQTSVLGIDENHCDEDGHISCVANHTSYKGGVPTMLSMYGYESQDLN